MLRSKTNLKAKDGPTRSCCQKSQPRATQEITIQTPPISIPQRARVNQPSRPCLSTKDGVELASANGAQNIRLDK